jgi:DNA invertase Pin-like site-specific DNA recombinase
MLIGYARISTAEQNFELQIDALEAAKCKKIFKDTAGGAKKDRKILQEALEYLREGDTLVVWRLDRLGRSLKQLIELMNEFQERGICFKSMVESIDTTTPMGKFFFHITGAFAELERNLIRERTNAGLKAARARGRKGGRPKAIAPETFDMALQLYNERKTPVESICKHLGIARRTFYRYLSQYKEKEPKKK